LPSSFDKNQTLVDVLIYSPSRTKRRKGHEHDRRVEIAFQAKSVVSMHGLYGRRSNVARPAHFSRGRQGKPSVGWLSDFAQRRPTMQQLRTICAAECMQFRRGHHQPFRLVPNLVQEELNAHGRSRPASVGRRLSCMVLTACSSNLERRGISSRVGIVCPGTNKRRITDVTQIRRQGRNLLRIQSSRNVRHWTRQCSVVPGFPLLQTPLQIQV
jgi:hypothetical protein